MTRDLLRLGELMSTTAIAQLVDGLEVATPGEVEATLRVAFRIHAGRAQDAVLHLERALRNRGPHRLAPATPVPSGRRPGPGEGQQDRT